MTPLHFVYWLQGFLEISGAKYVSDEQIEMIKAHIGLVLHPVIHGNVATPPTLDIEKLRELIPKWSQTVVAPGPLDGEKKIC